MNPFLTKLGIRAEVQEFVAQFFRTDERDNLLFDYGDGIEHFGFAFHKVPISQNFWMAGNRNFPQVREVVICSSVMEALAWLNNKQNAFSGIDGLLLLSAGCRVLPAHARWLHHNLPEKKYHFVFGKDLLGRMADLKLAAGLRGWPVEMYHDDGLLKVTFRSQMFAFSPEKFSLRAFETVSKYRFGVCCDKANGYDSYFDLLKASAFSTL